jgi:hypothetical protein
MIASELAEKFGIEPSVLSKRLGLYYQESGKDRERYLSEETVDGMQQVQELLVTGQAKSFKNAVQMVLGKYAEPIPPESTRLIQQQLSALQEGQQQALTKLAQILTIMESAIAAQIDERNQS